MKIAVDIDEVLCPFLEFFVPFMNKEFQTTYTLDDFKTYNLELVIDRPVANVVEVVRAFYREEIANLPAFEEALPILQRLKEKHELISLTSRHHEAIEKTAPWIEKHFPGIFSKIIFSSNPAIDSKKTKAMICKELQVDVLIEDDPRHIEVCIKEGICVFMPKKNWNEDINHKLVTRVENWQEIEHIINAPSSHSSKRK